jgi:hypothetical protein
LQTLFEQVRGPVATPQTPGAYAFGLLLVSIDGTVGACQVVCVG